MTFAILTDVALLGTSVIHKSALPMNTLIPVAGGVVGNEGKCRRTGLPSRKGKINIA